MLGNFGILSKNKKKNCKIHENYNFDEFYFIYFITTRIGWNMERNIFKL